MLTESSVFSKPKKDSPDHTFQELFKSLEWFAKQSYCEELIYDVVDGESMMTSLVYIWQQNSKRFNKIIPSDLKKFFLSRFVKSDEVYYRGLHSLRGGVLDVTKFDKVAFASCTTSKDVAAAFAVGWRNHFINSNEECYVYEVTGDLVLRDVGDYRDMGEEEVIIYNPVYNKVPLFKVLECSYDGIERLPDLGDMKIEKIRD